jgi:thiol-disulfide isomerase/thioredoxin
MTRALNRFVMVRRAIVGLTALLLLAFAPGDPMRSFDGGTAWLASQPLSPDTLRGKVVLVDFWEYTCLNCLRTFPYLREWYKRYHDDGFEIVGVQTPEFGFSGTSANVAEGMKQLGITWPVVVDTNFAIWKRFGVSEWPTELLYDAQGRLAELQLGEGNYPSTESNIQKLLHLANPQLSFPPVMALLPQDSYAKPGAICYPQTSEILVAHQPVANRPSFGDPTDDSSYKDFGHHKDGAIYLDGFWHATKEALVFGGGSGYFALKYHAIQVAVVMAADSGATRVDVTQDGNPIPRESAGEDLRYDANGMSYVEVNSPRSYALIMNKTFGDYELRLSPNGHGLGVYDFAFESCEVPQGASH